VTILSQSKEDATLVKHYLSVTNSAGNVIQHACENLHVQERADSLCGEILAVLKLVRDVEVSFEDRQAFVGRWRELLPGVLRENGRVAFAVLVEEMLRDLVTEG
jgi:hypothetical protein